MPEFKAWYGNWQNAAGVISMAHEDMTHQDELKMSTPFSDVKAWERIILHQFKSGKRVLRGPPGLWERMAAQWSSTTGRETPLPPS